MLQAVDCDIFLYADDTCLLYQHKDLDQITKELTKNFCNICDWFVDNKMSIHFGEDKTKSILFSTKNKKRKIGTLEIKYGNINIKQYSKVTYLACELDEKLSGKAMVLKVINKINGKLRFFCGKNRYLSPYLKKAPIQCYDLTTFQLCLFSLVSQPEQKNLKANCKQYRTNLLGFVFN